MKVIIKSSALHYQDGYQGTILTLPVSQSEMLAALDQAQIPHDSNEYHIHHRWDTPEIVHKALDHHTHAPTLAEANLLAARLVKLDESDMQLLEGIVRHRGSYDITDVINATHNLHRFSYYPGIVSDRQIGEFAIENQVTPELEALSDEMLDCLDCSKVGAKLRQDEGGILTRTGYIVPVKLGWDIIYDGSLGSSPQQEQKPEQTIQMGM